MNFRDRCDKMRQRILQEPKFRQLFYRMQAAFDDGQASPADIEDVIFIYENREQFERDDAELAELREAEKE